MGDIKDYSDFMWDVVYNGQEKQLILDSKVVSNKMDERNHVQNEFNAREHQDVPNDKLPQV